MTKEFVTIIGCGWLGTALGDQLVKEGHTVYGSYRNKERRGKLSMRKIKPFTFQLEKNGVISSTIIDKTTVLFISIPPIRGLNTKTFANHLKQMVARFNDDVRVIYTSSIGIYPHRTGVYTEDFVFLENEKKTTLVQAEDALKKQLGDRLTILRLGGLFGKKRHPALKLQGKSDLKNPFGFVNLVHRQDIIEIVKLLLQRESTGETYNVVYPEHPVRKEYYTKLYRKYNLEAIHFDDVPFIEREISSEKIQKELGFKFEHSVHDLDAILK